MLNVANNLNDLQTKSPLH